MEQLNKVELIGNVGSVKTANYSGATLTRFALATNLAYRDHNGDAVIETTWHDVTYWGSVLLKKGDSAHVIGRIHNIKYLGADGIERTSTEIVAKSVSVLCGRVTSEQ